MFVGSRVPADARDQLEKRKAAKQKAQEDMKAAEEDGKVEDVDRYSKRTVHMTKQHQEDCKTLLTLMGIPVVTVRRPGCQRGGACVVLTPTCVRRQTGSVRSRGPMCGTSRGRQGTTHRARRGWMASLTARCPSQVFAAASEDMDTLTFRTPYLVRFPGWLVVARCHWSVEAVMDSCHSTIDGLPGIRCESHHEPISGGHRLEQLARRFAAV